MVRVMAGENRRLKELGSINLVHSRVGEGEEVSALQNLQCSYQDLQASSSHHSIYSNQLSFVSQPVSRTCTSSRTNTSALQGNFIRMHAYCFERGANLSVFVISHLSQTITIVVVVVSRIWATFVLGVISLS